MRRVHCREDSGYIPDLRSRLQCRLRSTPTSLQVDLGRPRWLARSATGVERKAEALACYMRVRSIDPKRGCWSPALTALGLSNEDAVDSTTSNIGGV